MSAMMARPLAVLESGAIPLDSYRQRQILRLAFRRAAKVAAVFAIGVLGLIGSFADSAIARTSLLLIGAPQDGDTGDFDSVAGALAWATLTDIVVCAGIVMIGYCLLSRPSAQVVPLRPRRYKR
jgi:hypothetical protein